MLNTFTLHIYMRDCMCNQSVATNEQGLLADATKGLPDPTVHKHLPTLLPPLPTQSHLPPLGASSSEPGKQSIYKVAIVSVLCGVIPALRTHVHKVSKLSPV